MDTRDLSVGLVASKSPLGSVLCEILDHQGIIYETISPQMSKHYEVVILPENEDSAFDLAKRSADSENNIITCDNLLDLERIRQFLSGEISIKDDQLDLFVNLEEEKLVSKIKERFEDLDMPLVRKSFWPRNAKACCVITHDIDWFTYSPFHKAVLGGPKTLKLLKLFLTNLIRRKNYGWNIPEMMNLELNSGCKSTFLFQTEYPEIEREYLTRSLEHLKKNDQFEIALHASHSSHKDSDALHSELSLFRKNVGRDPLGVRYHILKFESPRTWQIEVDKNLQYDATFSYNEYFGFRSELCFPYHPYSGIQRLPLLELPTSFMDWTLLHRNLRRRSAESTFKLVKERVEKYNGLLTVNFHNTYINYETFPDIFELYKSLMSQVKSENYWIATASECAKWWNDRSIAKPCPKITAENEIVAKRSVVDLDVVGEKEFTIKYE